MENEFLDMANLKIVTQGLLNFYDWCRASLDQPCEDPVVGLAISINEGILADWYDKTVGSMWSKEADEQWEDWKRAETGLLEKHADRDNTGKIKFRKDGKFCYIIHELNNTIEVYSYEEENGNPVFNKIQKISTVNNYHAGDSAACAMKFSYDNKFIFCSNAGDNSVGAFSIDDETGMLTKKFVLPISGDYPKDIAIFPDSKHLVSLNHETDTMTFFNVDLENNTLIMNGPELKVKKGNGIVIMKVMDEK